MRDFKLKLIESNKEIGDEDYTFKLDEKATTFDLKVAFTEKEGYTPDELRLIYQRQEGFDEPLEDTELLEDIEKKPGIFLLEIPCLGTFDGKIHIRHDKEVDVLVGTLKEFEHYRLTKTSAALKVPWIKIGFFWPQNTLAVVEEETSIGYKTFQYVIQENWQLTISRSKRKDIKWEVKRRTSEGGLKKLEGKEKTYSMAKEKAFKVMPKDDALG